jgi:hypothetical protein
MASNLTDQVRNYRRRRHRHRQRGSLAQDHRGGARRDFAAQGNDQYRWWIN